MNTSKFIWHDGKFILWENASVHILAHTLHYGAGIFEGIRAYKTDGGPAVFRLQEHVDRFFYSASVIDLNLAYSKEDICNAILELINLNKLDSCYIRPIGFFGYGKMGLNPTGASQKVSIACWPWGAYLPHEMVDVKISSFIRPHPKSSIMNAKLCGNYLNSILAVKEVKNTDYHEVLLCDFEGHIAEGPGENIFIVKNDTLLTPAPGNILPGITRATIKQLAKSLKFKVVEKTITPEEVFDADEAFFTGTAAEITSIRSLDGKQIGTGKIGKITATLKKKFLDVVHGRDASFSNFLTYPKST